MSGSEEAATPEHGRTAPSRDITVAGLRQILVWPLALAMPSDGSATTRSDADRLTEDLSAPKSGWSRIHDLLDHAPPPRTPWVPARGDTETEADHAARTRSFAERMEAAQTYGEFVYFYDFLQTTIFRAQSAATDGATSPPGEAIRLWRHTEVTGIEFDVASDGQRITLRADVDRLQIYVFDSGAAVVVLETDFGSGRPVVARSLPRKRGDEFGPEAERSLKLSDVLSVNDHLRRAYTAFFDVEDDAAAFGRDGRVTASPARVPSRVVWLGANGKPLALPLNGPEEEQVAEFHPTALDQDLAFVRDRHDRHGRRRAPVAKHWQRILAPLRFDGYGRGEDDLRPQWRHVLDERIPLMSFISLTGAARALDIGPTARDDWAEAQRRDLGLVSPGDWVRLCAADEAGGDPMPYNPNFLADFEKEACYDRFMASPQTTSAVRVLMAGYHFSIVGAGHGFFDKILVHHFRRHYFQMVLLANMELASLLATSSRISRAVVTMERMKSDAAANRARQWFREELVEIEEDFLTFVHRYRFNGVSNQIQPTELFDRLRKAMRLEGLYRDVREELAAAVQFNGGQEQGEVARSSQLLAAVAAVAAPVGLAFTFLGISLLAEPVKTILSGAPPDNPTKSIVASLLNLLLWLVTGRDLTARPDMSQAWMGLSFHLTVVSIVTWAFLWISEGVYRRMARDIQPERSRNGPDGKEPTAAGDKVVIDRLRAFQLSCFTIALASFAATIWLGLTS